MSMCHSIIYYAGILYLSLTGMAVAVILFLGLIGLLNRIADKRRALRGCRYDG